MSISPQQAVEAVREVLAAKGQGDLAVSASSTFAELEMDSLDVAEALIILEEQAGVELDESGGLRTVGDLAAVDRREDGG